MASYYDAYYYRHCCGAPWKTETNAGDETAWQTFFTEIAEQMLQTMHPKTVLDAGCGMGLLVHLLRQRGVAAYGIDISEYALHNAYPAARPYCRLASLADPAGFGAPFPATYDLIVCIEVLEHLAPDQAAPTIANLCRRSDVILFSSSPYDYKEVTHLNVQPPDYWAGLFARHGFLRDADFDATFISQWAARFRRADQPIEQIVRGYERKFFPLWQENIALRRQGLELQKRLAHSEQIIAELDQRIQRIELGNAGAGQPAGEAPASTAGEATQAAALDAAAPPAAAPTAVLILSQDVVGQRMAGPGIRYYALAKVLSGEFAVTLAIPNPPEAALEKPHLHLVHYRIDDWSSIYPLIQDDQRMQRKADVVLTSDHLITLHRDFYNLDIPIIIDGYDPHMAEWLEALSYTPDQAQNWQPYANHLMHQYLVGDFFIVASERQRDWWLGLLENAGRINPWTYAQDPSLRQLLDVVPFALPENPPIHTRQVMRGVWPGIGETDKIILWGGGLWMWLDPLTAIRAVAQVWQTRRDVRLVFPGVRRPMPGQVGPPTHYQAARQEAERLGLLDQAVFFSDWIDYTDWPNILIESDLALSLHAQTTLEAHLAYRSRVLDCIWAGLPVITTGGDLTSELIRQHSLGEIIQPQDVNGLAQKIIQLIDIPRPIFQHRAAAARAQLTWEKAAGPLLRFCRNPRRAPDKLYDRRRIGYPYYLQEPPLVEDNAHLHALVIHTLQERQRYLSHNQELFELVQAFERRRVVRMLNWVMNLKRRLLP